MDSEMDLEKGMKEAMGVPDAQIPVLAMAPGEKELLIPDLQALPIDGAGGVVAANMNGGKKKWLPSWLVVAGSVILLTNHIIHAAPKDQLFPPELAMFIVYLCAICLMLRTMKQMM